MRANVALPAGITRPASRAAGRWERSLGRRDVFSLDADERITLSCLDGMLWVTLDIDAEDYVLAAGQALRLPAGCRATLQALAESRFGVARA